jgi:hypothetical protein
VQVDGESLCRKSIRHLAQVMNSVGRKKETGGEARRWGSLTTGRAGTIGQKVRGGNEMPRTVSDYSCCKGKQIATADVFYSRLGNDVHLSVRPPGRRVQARAQGVCNRASPAARSARTNTHEQHTDPAQCLASKLKFALFLIASCALPIRAASRFLLQISGSTALRLPAPAKSRFARPAGRPPARSAQTAARPGCRLAPSCAPAAAWPGG